jgi:DNA replication licensing factor MCM4
MDVEEEESGPQTVIWGTLVSISKTIETFRNFLLTFTPSMRNSKLKKFKSTDLLGDSLYPDSMANERVYKIWIREMIDLQQVNLNISGLDLFSFDEKLYKGLVTWPQEVIPIMDQVLKVL